MIPIGILTASSSSSFSFLLDDYPGAAVAYSLRKLRSAYTGSCIQVRRSSDNATQDINFVNNVIDQTSLLTFCGGGNGFISIWYDQSGNSKNAIQSTLANQPQIVLSGAIISVNSKPALQVDNTDFLSFTAATVNLRTAFSVIKRTAINTNYFIYGGGVSHYHFNNLYYFECQNQYITSLAVDNTADQVLISGYNSGPTTSFQYKNNNLILSSITGQPYSSSIAYLFTLTGTTFFSSGYGQEIVIYGTNNSANLSAINTNINTYYTIY
jgi:hypothetical protein